LECIEESLAMPGRQMPSPGTLMREAALELRAHHGAMAAGDTLMRQALAWHLERPAEERGNMILRRATARALYDTGDWETAADHFAALAGDEVAVADCGAVHHAQLQGHLDHGYLGVIAMRRGEHQEAQRIDAMLAAARGEYLFGSTHYWRAAMAALGGDADAALRLLRRAFAEGMPYEPFIHADPHFDALRGTPAFQALLTPRH
ncbi:MAG TPA: hypothetical protein VE869_01505, partial [Gemmatimonas sp.]|nr:hypothetical protein [Gemmatimonas sp.]